MIMVAQSCKFVKDYEVMRAKEVKLMLFKL